MRSRTTFILLGTTLALLAWVIFVERNSDTSAEAAIKGTRVVTFDPEKVNGIVIEREDGKAVIERQKDGIWVMREPLADRLDQERTAALVALAADMKIVDTITTSELKKEDAEPEDLGFGASQIRVTLLADDAEAAAFIVGDRTEITDAIYVRTEGDWLKTPVHVAWGGILEILELPFSDMRDRRVLHAKAESFRRMKFIQEPASIVLDWNAEEDRWILSKPLQTRADKTAIENRIAALLELEIESFIDQPTPASEAAFGDDLREVRFLLHGTRGTINLELADSEAAKAGDFLYGRISGRPGAFKIPRTILGKFTVNPNDVRDRALAAFDEDLVSAIAIQKFHANGEIAPPVMLKRLGNAWAVRRGGRDEPAHSPKVAALIKAFNSESILEFADDAVAALDEYGLDKPAMRMTFTTLVDQGKDKKPLERKSELLIAAFQGGRIFAHFKGTPFVYQIDPNLYAMCDPNSLSWKSPEVLRFSMFALKNFIVTRPPDPPIDISYDAATNKWKAVSAGMDLSASVDVPKMNDFAKTISALRANRWSASPGEGQKTIREKTFLDITVNVDDKANNKVIPVRIRLAPTNARTLFYGQRNEEPDIFIVPRDTVGKLLAPLVKREAPAPTPAPVPAP